MREERGEFELALQKHTCFFVLFPLFFSCLFFVRFRLLFLNPKHFGCVFIFYFISRKSFRKEEASRTLSTLITDDFWTTTRQHLASSSSRHHGTVPRRRFGVALFLRRLFLARKMDARRRVGFSRRLSRPCLCKSPLLSLSL